MATKPTVTLESLNENLNSHIVTEEETLKRGEERMDAIEKDLQPIQKMYYAIIGSATVGAVLVAVLLFIYTNDRSEMKEMSNALRLQGQAIERLLVTTNGIAGIIEKDTARLDRHIEKSNGSH